MSLLEISDLRIALNGDRDSQVVKGLDLSIEAGQTTCLVGESGSGKSQIMMAAMGLLSSNGRAQGSARFRDQELLGLSPLERM